MDLPLACFMKTESWFKLQLAVMVELGRILLTMLELFGQSP